MSSGNQIPPGELAQALAELRDIRLPADVATWPPAPGWWIALALGVVVTVALVLTTRARRRSLRLAAIAELERLNNSFRITDDIAALARGLSALLRRTALARFGRRTVAGLHGSEWLEFLATAAAPNGFPAEIGEAMTVATYARPSRQTDIATTDGRADAWVAAVRAWIRSVS
jgi:hypothetical protein